MWTPHVDGHHVEDDTHGGPCHFWNRIPALRFAAAYALESR
jgi:hypothetical protein